jgi:RNA polymerase sigma-70 factor (ECF subfamily)
MELSDLEAAELAQKGDPQAFRVLVNRHARWLFRMVFRMVGNEHDAEDVVQETFLRAYKQLHRFDGRASLRTWLCRIATNCALDLLRSRKSRKEQLVMGAEEEAAGLLDRIAADQPSPERLTHSTQIAWLLESALRRLTDMERSAFVLRHCEGCGIEEIAKTLGVEQNAAKHSVYRAVTKLRQALLPVWGMAR